MSSVGSAHAFSFLPGEEAACFCRAIMFSSLVILAPALVSLSLGALYTNPSQLKLSHDFIVVGGELPTEI
jgi:hypothetical protein